MMNQARLQIWLWWGFHALLGLSIPFVLVLMIGCKKAKATKEDLGPEVDPDSISEALGKAVNDASLDRLAVGQYNEYVITQRVENEEGARTLGGSRAEVIKRDDSDTTSKYTLRITRAERLQDGKWETTVTEEPLVVEKPSIASLLLPATEPRPLSAAQFTPLAGRPVKRQTYHKLREFTGALPAPYKVRMRPGCGGLNPCEIPVRYVSFDVVEWYDDENYRKLSLDLGFSLVTPFIPFGEGFEKLNGLLVLNCRATYIPVDDRNYYVRQCANLEDFAF